MSVQGVVTDLSVRLGSVQALDGVDLAIPRGHFLALLGPSGSGKTTTLNALAGFVRPDRGSITFDGRNMDGVPPHERDIGIVFQGYALFPHMSVEENVAFPLRMRGVSHRDRVKRVRETLQLVGLVEHAPRSVRTLSGGQQQRVALARAVVFEPRMLLLDEPLAALDKQLRDSMQLELKRLQQRLGITTVAVTHDQVEALTMADTVAVMNEGRVEQVAPPRELYMQPKSLFVAAFLGEANILSLDRGELVGFGRAGRGGASGHAVIRPEQIEIGSAGADQLEADGIVEDVTFQGARVRSRVRLVADQEILLIVASPPVPGEPIAQVGQQVRLGLPAEAVHVIADPDAGDGRDSREEKPQSSEVEVIE